MSSSLFFGFGLFVCLLELFGICLLFCWDCVVVVRGFLCLQRRTHFYKVLPEKHNISSNVALVGFLETFGQQSVVLK